jgi:hypothetical protein
VPKVGRDGDNRYCRRGRFDKGRHYRSSKRLRQDAYIDYIICQLGVAVRLSLGGIPFNDEIFPSDEAKAAQLVEERTVRSMVAWNKCADRSDG